MAVNPADKLKTIVEHELWDGTIVQNVYHHRVVAIAPWADATVVTAIKGWIDGAYNFWEGHCEQNVIPKLSTVDKVEWDGSKWAVTYNVGVFTPGFVPTVTWEPTPNQYSPFIVFQTERPKTKGKKFLFGLCEDENDGSVLASAVVTALVSLAGDILTDVPLSLPLEYLVSGVPRKAVNDWYDFIAAVVTNIGGSQRRRRPGVGV